MGSPQESDKEPILCGFCDGLKSDEFDIGHRDLLGQRERARCGSGADSYAAPIDGLNLDFRLAPKNRDVLRQRNANRMSTDHLNDTYPFERPRMNNPLVPNANKTRIFTYSCGALLS